LRARLNIVWLMRDDAASAERELDAAIGSWSSASYQVQHFFALVSRCNLMLYDGRPEVAAELLARDEKPLDRSMLPRVTLVRIEVKDLRARIALALGAKAKDAAERERHLAGARKLAKQLARDAVPVAGVLSVLIEACATALAGDRSSAISKLRIAATTAETLDTMLHATAARRRLGEAIGGEEGATLIARADAWFAEQGVRNPERMAALFTPGW
jgi:hypothetical protein